jgi:hypothetical protein
MENQLWSIMKDLGIETHISEKERAEPEHSKIVKEVEKKEEPVEKEAFQKCPTCGREDLVTNDDYIRHQEGRYLECDPQKKEAQDKEIVKEVEKESSTEVEKESSTEVKADNISTPPPPDPDPNIESFWDETTKRWLKKTKTPGSGSSYGM